MRKFAVPATVVPGAHFDGARHGWTLPEPVRFAVHTRPLRRVPIYRGLPASLVRYARAQLRRARRKVDGEL